MNERQKRKHNLAGRGNSTVSRASIDGNCLADKCNRRNRRQCGEDKTICVSNCLHIASTIIIYLQCDVFAEVDDVQVLQRLRHLTDQEHYHDSDQHYLLRIAGAAVIK